MLVAKIQIPVDVTLQEPIHSSVGLVQLPPWPTGQPSLQRAVRKADLPLTDSVNQRESRLVTVLKLGAHTTQYGTRFVPRSSGRARTFGPIRLPLISSDALVSRSDMSRALMAGLKTPTQPLDIRPANTARILLKVLWAVKRNEEG